MSDCVHADEHPLMLSCPCGYLSRTARGLIAEELRSLATTVNTGVFPDEQAPGMRRALVALLSNRADELCGDPTEADYVTCGGCGQAVFAMPFERAEVMRRHSEQAHP